MHMADALVSPAVGGAFWAAAAGTIAYCSARVRKDLDDRKVPLMGVLGAFVFAAGGCEPPERAAVCPGSRQAGQGRR